MASIQKIETFLRFDDNAEEAIAFYLTVFDGKVNQTLRNGAGGPGKPGSVLTIDFELAGVQFIALNGGPNFRFTEAISLSVDCENQAERHLPGPAHGRRRRGEHVQLAEGQVRPVAADRPRRLPELLMEPDPERAQRAMASMMTMRKIDIAALERAADGRRAQRVTRIPPQSVRPGEPR